MITAITGTFIIMCAKVIIASDPLIDCMIKESYISAAFVKFEQMEKRFQLARQRKHRVFCRDPDIAQS